jgi:hypothetical protein
MIHCQVDLVTNGRCFYKVWCRGECDYQKSLIRLSPQFVIKYPSIQMRIVGQVGKLVLHLHRRVACFLLS